MKGDQKELAKRIIEAHAEYGDIVSVLLSENMSTSAYYFNKAALGERILNELLEAANEVLS